MSGFDQHLIPGTAAAAAAAAAAAPRPGFTRLLRLQPNQTTRDGNYVANLLWQISNQKANNRFVVDPLLLQTQA